MEQIKGKAYKYFMCFITGLMMGTLIGTVILTALVSYRMDEHYKKIVYLENIIQDKDAKLEKLEKSINANNIILKNIELYIISEEDDLDEIGKIDIEKAIKEKYNSLLGKEVKNIDADILIEVIDKRILKIDKKEYRLFIQRLILTEILKIYVKVELR